MELFRNIFFNTDKIVEGADIKVTYAGTLFQNGSQNVEVHCGYGPNWENAQDIQMTKTDLGFQANINVAAGGTLNFCFKNEYSQWDNNDGQNYIFEIEAANDAVADAGAYSIGRSNNIDYVYDNTDVAGIPGVAEAADNVANDVADNAVKVADAAANNVEAANNAKAADNANKSLVSATPTWGELIKKTWANFVNYISKLFSGKKAKANDNN